VWLIVVENNVTFSEQQLTESKKGNDDKGRGAMVGFNGRL
jgi:hypothetical protein